jgi:hypothetical protein
MRIPWIGVPHNSVPPMTLDLVLILLLAALVLVPAADRWL